MNNTEKAKLSIAMADNIAKSDYKGAVVDCDTILADIMDHVDARSFEEMIGHEILENYLQIETENGREMYEALFYDLTDVEFSDYLNVVLANTAPCIKAAVVDDEKKGEGDEEIIDYQNDPQYDEWENYLCERNNELSAAALKLCATIAKDKNLEHDQMFVGEVLDCAEEILRKQNYNTCYPFYGENEEPCYLGEDCTNPDCKFRKKVQ